MVLEAIESAYEELDCHEREILNLRFVRNGMASFKSARRFGNASSISWKQRYPGIFFTL